MNISLDDLRPSALATLAALLSQEADVQEDWRATVIRPYGEPEGETVERLRAAAQEAAEALIANVGQDTALAMLMEAGALPDYLDL